MEQARRGERRRPEGRHDPYRARRLGRYTLCAAPERTDGTPQTDTEKVLAKISKTLVAVGAPEESDLQDEQEDQELRVMTLAGAADPEAAPHRPKSDDEF